jgi:hypothetical protein
MAYSKTKLKSSGDKASPCFRLFEQKQIENDFLPEFLPFRLLAASFHCTVLRVFKIRNSLKYNSPKHGKRNKDTGCAGKVVNDSPRNVMQARMRKEEYLLFILDLNTGWGEWSASHPSRGSPAGKDPPVPIVQEAGWASEVAGTQRLAERSFASAENRISVVQSVVRHHSLCATQFLHHSLRSFHYPSFIDDKL